LWNAFVIQMVLTTIFFVGYRLFVTYFVLEIPF
jgi:hypothetical protein